MWCLAPHLCLWRSEVLLDGSSRSMLCSLYACGRHVVQAAIDRRTAERKEQKALAEAEQEEADAVKKRPGMKRPACKTMVGKDQTTEEQPEAGKGVLGSSTL